MGVRKAVIGKMIIAASVRQDSENGRRMDKIPFSACFFAFKRLSLFLLLTAPAITLSAITQRRFDSYFDYIRLHPGQQ